MTKNNTLSNLEYVTPQENADHAKRFHLIAHKLTEADRAKILALREQGLSHTAISLLFDVTPGCITHFLSGRTWRVV